jgi:Domain of unknown function (DUF1905)/Bacteriocin-protection, YdeI or OmpD-Associated
MSALRFHATIRIVGLNPYVRVSAVRAGALKPGWRKPMPVRIRIDGQPETPWRINMMPMGDGAFFVYLHGDVRRASNTKVGDRVLVDVEFDANYRNGPMHRMPDWFRKPLAANPQAAAEWKRLMPSLKKEILRYLSRLRSADARTRNVRRALAALSRNGTRYMGRSWNRSAP